MHRLGSWRVSGRSERRGYNSTVKLIEAGAVEFEPQRHVEGFIEGSVKVCV